MVVLMILFLAPILVAMWLRFGANEWQPVTGNHGQLIQPPVSLRSLEKVEAQRGYWLIMQLQPRRCERACQVLTDALRRVQVALGKDSHRVHTLPVRVGSPLGQTLEAKASGVEPGTVLLVDPRGFLMMRYAFGFDPNGLLKDLERVLRYSQVGVQ